MKWETTVTRNVGLDYTLFGGKLTGSIEYYKNTTKDLLIAFPVSGSGYDYQYRNLGKTENKGFEISLTWNIISKKNYELSFNGNVGFNKNKVKNLGTLSQYPASSGWASTQIQDDFIVKPGHSVGEIYGYVTAGRYEVSDFEDYYASGEKWVLKQDVASNAGVIGASYLRPGALKLKNIDDSDNVIDEKDRTVIGNPSPDCIFGFNNTFSYKNFDLSIFFQGALGNQVWNGVRASHESMNSTYNQLATTLERWTGEGSSYSMPRAIYADPNRNNRASTRWVEDGSYLRLKNLTFGYRFTQDWLKKIGAKSLRLYLSFDNLWTLTNYSGLDPEVGLWGLDYGIYPTSRVYMFGASVKF